MISIKPKGQNIGELKAFYKGENIKIIESTDLFTSQPIKKFIKTVQLNGGETACGCIEFSLLNRTFLMAFENRRLYEMVSNDGIQTYILLYSAYFDISAHFLENNSYINNINFYLLHEYSPIAMFSEHFILQLKMSASNEVMEWYRKAKAADDLNQ